MHRSEQKNRRADISRHALQGVSQVTMSDVYGTCRGVSVVLVQQGQQAEVCFHASTLPRFHDFFELELVHLGEGCAYSALR